MPRTSYFADEPARRASSIFDRQPLVTERQSRTMDKLSFRVKKRVPKIRMRLCMVRHGGTETGTRYILRPILLRGTKVWCLLSVGGLNAQTVDARSRIRPSTWLYA